MPPASVSLRLLAFMVPVLIAICGVQPVLGSFTGGVPKAWGAWLTVPSLLAAVVVTATARLSDRGGAVPPPWSAYALLPGSFLLAGAAAMDIFGAFVVLPQVAATCWTLLAAGTAAWCAALVVVRRAAR